jgi:hypothetical protein
MKIEFDLDDHNLLYDIADGIFVAMLKRQLKDSKEFLISEHYRHPTDIEVAKDNIKACKVLLDYYGKNDEK